MIRWNDTDQRMPALDRQLADPTKVEERPNAILSVRKRVFRSPGKAGAAAEIARRAQMIAPISHKSGYTYLGSDRATQRQRLLEGSAKTPRMETGARVIGHAARPRQVKHKRYELAGWEFKPDKRGVRQKRAILRELPGD